MKIWLINHYAVPPQYYPLSRPSLIAKNLIKMGHDVVIIAASTVHNSENSNLIENGDKVKKIIDNGIPYILINCTTYQGNGIKRLRNIWEFAKRLPKILDTTEKPDVIVATSFDPLSCYKGIKYAKKYNIKAVAEIADLWPETLVAYTGMNPSNPVVKYIRGIEKKIYTQSDAIVFTMEGAYNYIIEQGWEKDVPWNKVYYINNGIDLEQFDFNKSNYQLSDNDLDNRSSFKIVYAGAIRKVNNIDKLLDIAKLVKNPNVKFLIWGDGDQLESLKERKKKENIKNVVFKDRVDKKYVAYITSKADLNYAHNEASPLFRFGISFNKIFDYLAAGKPILCDFDAKYNPIEQLEAGFCIKSGDAGEVAQLIDKLSEEDATNLDKYSRAARKGAEQYDFKVLTSKLMDVIESI